MNLPRYQLSSNENLMTFEFVSEGPKGQIHKLVQFSKTNVEDVYNLAFGDKEYTTGHIDDNIISNNSDSEKVLASVIATVYAFTDRYPDAFVYATGSSKSRTRLYRMGISKYLPNAQLDFEIYGEIENGWESFSKGMDYQGFLIKRKKS